MEGFSTQSLYEMNKCVFSVQEETSRDHTDRKGSEDVDSSETDLAANEGKGTFLLQALLIFLPVTQGCSQGLLLSSRFPGIVCLPVD